MAVLRIVPNIGGEGMEAAKSFYREVLGMETVMDHGWITTLAGSNGAQLSFAEEGGSGTPVPDLSVEVDDLEMAYQGALASNLPITYGPAQEPWGVRRFFLRDPSGRLVNILSHGSRADGGEPKE